jgi:hypothetical protein
MSGWWRKKRRSNDPEFQESSNNPEFHENVYGIMIQDEEVASLARTVLSLTALLAVVEIWQSLLVAGRSGGSSSVVRLVIYFGIPAVGYYAIKQKNRSLLGGFTFCTVCAAFIQVVSLVGMLMATSVENARCEAQLIRLRVAHKPIAVQQAAEEACKHLHPHWLENMAAPVLSGACLTVM